jgi:hypothetical protein
LWQNKNLHLKLPQNCGKIKIKYKIATKVWQNRTSPPELPQCPKIQKALHHSEGLSKKKAATYSPT